MKLGILGRAGIVSCGGRGGLKVQLAFVFMNRCHNWHSSLTAALLRAGRFQTSCLCPLAWSSLGRAAGYYSTAVGRKMQRDADCSRIHDLRAVSICVLTWVPVRFCSAVQCIAAQRRAQHLPRKGKRVQGLEDGDNGA